MMVHKCLSAWLLICLFPYYHVRVLLFMSPPPRRRRPFYPTCVLLCAVHRPKGAKAPYPTRWQQENQLCGRCEPAPCIGAFASAYLLGVLFFIALVVCLPVLSGLFAWCDYWCFLLLLPVCSSTCGLIAQGWVEFKRKKIAKRVAEALNGNIVGGKRNNFHHDFIWNMKYLPGYKWHNLQEAMEQERVRRQFELKTHMARMQQVTTTHLRRTHAAARLQRAVAKGAAQYDKQKKNKQQQQQQRR